MTDVFLLPGRLAVLDEAGVIRTVLGSCVAVVLYDTSGTICGVNHYLLPREGGVKDGNRLKYGTHAIPALIQALLDHGAVQASLKAAIYGGGSVVSTLSKDFSIGEGNIAMARESLAAWRIPLVAEDVGGTQGRKIAVTLPGPSVRVAVIAGQG